MQAQSVFISVHRAAFHLGVPVAWLRREAIAGRVPCLRAGRRLFFELDVVRHALLARGADNAGERRAAI